MRLPIARLLLLAPVLALLTASTYPPPESPTGQTVISPGSRAAYVTVEAQFDAYGTPSFGVYHDTELVRPGDTLEFRCACAPGLEFKVSEPRLVINKDALWDDLLQGNPAGARNQVEEASQWVASLSGPPPPGLKEFLQDFQKVIPHLPATQLFVDWKDPDFHAGDAAIGPFEVADRGQTFAATWKFAWTVRAAGEQDPSKWVDLDPHIEEEPFHKDY